MKTVLFFFASFIFLMNCNLTAGINSVCDIIYVDDDGIERRVRERATFARKVPRDNKKIAQPERSTVLKDTATFLFCTACHSEANLTQIHYEILTERKNLSEGANIVGGIDLQFIPQEMRFRIANIEVNENDRRQHHATHALKTLFIDLKHRTAGDFKVVLDVANSNAPALKLYKNFGFKQTSQFADVLRMEVELKQASYAPQKE
jgi:ribosomal protein S18 acetylase RimI-like enzyme